ncbi:aminoacyl-tRNA hydrolase [Myxococcota bacterium]|nr:aminoacyl-tRNA hydrolase [Myxococcota bacterium]MBU1382810.1 aminoacyl-tRNA hydrolase [Myxococcota bacterium]MBU1497367.1 aminoacyl-tRNA hydrolase [Myxococcota bacterium]
MEQESYLIVGLGNPGAEYSSTRHNIGAMLLESIAKEIGAPSFRKKYDGLYTTGTASGVKVHLLFPQTYMNLSGSSVKKALKNSNCEVNHLVVLHDEVDLEFGKMKIKIGGGLAGHNGLKSIFEQIGSKEFIRIRLGVGRPANDMVKHVLGKFSPSERIELNEILVKGTKAALALLLKGPTYAMNTFNG